MSGCAPLTAAACPSPPRSCEPPTVTCVALVAHEGRDGRPIAYRCRETPEIRRRPVETVGQTHAPLALQVPPVPLSLSARHATQVRLVVALQSVATCVPALQARASAAGIDVRAGAVFAGGAGGAGAICRWARNRGDLRAGTAGRAGAAGARRSCRRCSCPPRTRCRLGSSSRCTPSRRTYRRCKSRTCCSWLRSCRCCSLPAAHAVHARFVVALHAVEAYVPALQVAQVVQLVAFVPVL